MSAWYGFVKIMNVILKCVNATAMIKSHWTYSIQFYLSSENVVKQDQMQKIKLLERSEERQHYQIIVHDKIISCSSQQTNTQKKYDCSL